MSEHQGLPVAGYRPQTNTTVNLVNENKMIEESRRQELRDMFASHALNGLISYSHTRPAWAEKSAYEYADAMLAARYVKPDAGA